MKGMGAGGGGGAAVQESPPMFSFDPSSKLMFQYSAALPPQPAGGSAVSHSGLLGVNYLIVGGGAVIGATFNARSGATTPSATPNFNAGAGASFYNFSAASPTVTAGAGMRTAQGGSM